MIQNTKDEDTLNNSVQAFSRIITETAKLTLKSKSNQKKKPNRPWISGKLKRLEKETKLKAQYMITHQTGESRQKYFLALKRLRKERKYAKRHFRNTKIAELKGIQQKNPRQFWKILQNLKNDSTIENYSDNISPGDWYDYLTKQNHFTSDQNTSVTEELHLNLKNPTFTELDYTFKINEIKQAVGKLKNNKTPGIDCISNEMLKSCNDNILLCLTNLFNKVFTLSLYPEIWCKGHISNIHKKGSYFVPQNYRSITITSALGKLFNLTLNQRLQKFLSTNDLITPLQIGFQQDSSTVDHIFTLKTIIDKYTTSSQKLYTCFVDFQKAFDTVWHQGLLLKLTRLGINNYFYRIIQNMYSKTQLSVKVQGKLTDYFTSDVGVRQGDNLSPTLFNIFVNDIQDFMKKQNNTDPVKIGSTTLNCLLYADDVVLISRTKEGLQACINAIQKFSDQWLLKVNLSKTKVLIFNSKGLHLEDNFTYNNETIQCTNSYTYLGIDFVPSGSFKYAIENLRKKGMKAMFSLNKLLDTNIDIETVLHIYDNTIKPIITYGSEVWGITLLPNNMQNNPQCIFKSLDNNKLSQLETKFYKRILQVKRNTSTLGVRGELGRHPTSLHAIINSIKFFYTIKSKENKLVYEALKELELQKRQSTKNWLNQVQQLSSLLGVNAPVNLSKNKIKQLGHKITKQLKSTYENYWYQQLNQENSKNKNKGGNKLRTYKQLKTNFELEPYLTNIDNKEHCKLTTRLRLSCHPLNIEAMRGHEPDPAKRTCKICNLNNIEDEPHFVTICPAYNQPRDILMATITQNCPQITHLDNTNKFIWIMTNENKHICKALGKYIEEAFTIRKSAIRN